MTSSGIPYTEFYRPKQFEHIVLDTLNRQIMNNMIQMSYFPNLLFYGPPGTGKTTTIVNLINAYQERNNEKNPNLIIHLNASDERGIDTIRSQINMFVNSKPMFTNGMKFVILDEVDYMTKNAQQALRYLLQTYARHVRFCLICNYISKIDEGLQNEFMTLHFNQLPADDIIAFLSNISVAENLQLSHSELSCIQQKYKSDMRSMINFMQSNRNMNERCRVIENGIWDKLFDKLKKKERVDTFIHSISIDYNIDKKNMIKDFCKYVIKEHPECVNTKLLSMMENIIHSPIQHSSIEINYFTLHMSAALQAHE